jgi:16S rRNA processing protein RimM
LPTEATRPTGQGATADIVVMGRILGPYGIKGWLKARPYTASPDTLLEYNRWWLTAQGGHDAWQEFAVVSARIHADTVLAEIEGLTDRESSATWRGALVGVPRAKLPKLRQGEMYWTDLIGFAVVNRGGEPLGKVTGMLDTAAHAILRVVGEDGSERLIPLVPAFLDAIEADVRRIQVDWQLDY